MATRPKVPRAVKEEVLYEAGNRCAVCCGEAALELHHIIPWAIVQEHTADNLICMCANCHTRSHDEQWTARHLRRYKAKPCVSRRVPTKPKSPERRQIVLRLEGRFEDFDEGRQRQLASAMATLLELDVKEFRVVKVEEGSVLVTLELPAEYADRLLDAFARGDARLNYLLHLPDTIEAAEPRDAISAGLSLLNALGRMHWSAWLAILLALVAASGFLGAMLFSLLRGPAVGPVTAAAVPDLASRTGDMSQFGVAAALAIATTIPGLALYYAAMVRAKNALSMVMQVVSVFALVVVLWVNHGYSLVFTSGNAVFGGFDRLFLKGVSHTPELLFVAFHGILAAMACALVVGATAERMKHSAVLMFTVLWFSFSYVPMAHMTWFGAESPGLLHQWGVADFAGGLAVHVNAGVAGLIGALVLGKRVGHGREAFVPHSLLLAVVGVSIMWLGWFGIHAAASMSSPSLGGAAILNTLLAPSAGLLAWMIAESLVKGRASVLGALSGVLSGLVAITPGAGFVAPSAALIIGLAAGVAGLWGVTGLKRLTGADDALDVFGIHAVTAVVGVILTGAFASQAQVLAQLKGLLVTVLWSAMVSLLAFKVVDVVLGVRIREREEREGLDAAELGEAAYSDRLRD